MNRVTITDDSYVLGITQVRGEGEWTPLDPSNQFWTNSLSISLANDQYEGIQVELPNYSEIDLILGDYHGSENLIHYETIANGETRYLSSTIQTFQIPEPSCLNLLLVAILLCRGIYSSR